MTKQTRKSGFTLVELAIVLVIIGLIVGGVLAGADLIKSATMQKATKQIGDIEVGATTFRTKYNALPGDLRDPTAVFTGMTAATTPNGDGNGDGDTLIESTSADVTVCTTEICVAGETAVFSYQLAQAGYIKDPVTFRNLASFTATEATINDLMFAKSALGRGALLIPTSRGGKNYVVITGPVSADAVAGVSVFSAGITALQASNIDTKLDDGVPTTGGVVSVTISTSLPAVAGQGGSAATGDCYNVTTYNAALPDLECAISIVTSF